MADTWRNDIVRWTDGRHMEDDIVRWTDGGRCPPLRIPISP